MGQEVKNFELAICRKFGFKYSVMLNSGSSANLVMLTAMQVLMDKDWPEKPEVIVPAVSWSTTFTPFYYLNMTPVFVDIDKDNFGLSVERVKEAISPKTVAILAVNVLGLPANLELLRGIADERGLTLLEDNCESLGAKLGGQYTGSFGLASSHSSFFSHHISTMEGGWISTNDEKFYQACLSLRAHGWVREQPQNSPLRTGVEDGFNSLFHFVLPGLNFRPLELEAAIGIEQLKKLDEMNGWRSRNEKIFRDLFARSKNVRLQSGQGQSTSFALPMVLTGGLSGKRQTVADALIQNGVECRPIIAGNFTKQPVMKYLNSQPFPILPNADDVHFNGLYIGNHPKDLSEEIQLAWEAFEGVESRILNGIS
jgi:CDP-6-deoxy-D-xylo-4-hexulose-3-dehydrase